MILLLNKLSNWLQHHGFIKEAQAIKELPTSEPGEYAEPWHEEAVKEFGAEPISEDEYAEQQFGAGLREIMPPNKFDQEETVLPEELLKRIADQENFKILQIGGRSSFVGMGEYGAVIRGIYNGKPVVAKIISNLDFKKSEEGDNWRRILKAAKNFPPELQKHIPHIYAIKNNYIEDPLKPEDPISYEMIVMEELYPLNKSMSDILNIYTSIENPKEKGKLVKLEDEISDLLKDDDYLYKISDIITSGIKSYFGLDTNFQDLKSIEIFNLISNLKPLGLYSTQKISKEIFRYLVRKYDLKSDDGVRFEKSDDGISFHDYIYSILIDLIKPDSIPMYKGYPTDFWKALPETSYFYQTLQKLSDDYGIDWGDVHRNNIMLDRDGNLKIIDVGLYNMSKNKKIEPTVTLP